MFIYQEWNPSYIWYICKMMERWWFAKETQIWLKKTVKILYGWLVKRKEYAVKGSKSCSFWHEKAIWHSKIDHSLAQHLYFPSSYKLFPFSFSHNSQDHSVKMMRGGSHHSTQHDNMWKDCSLKLEYIQAMTFFTKGLALSFFDIRESIIALAPFHIGNNNSTTNISLL